MKSVIAAIAAIAASVVSAQNIVSSQPSTNQVVTAGTTANIVWAPVDGVISQIDLRKGDKAALTFISTVATNVPATAGTYAWNVDASLPAGADYALSFGISPNVTYTPFFAIKAAAGGAAPSSGAPSSSSAAPAASSGAAKPSASAPASASSPAAKPSGSASGSTTSAPKATTSPSAANKNAAAVGVAAVAGAVVAALI